jgi:rare lipoprotein A
MGAAEPIISRMTGAAGGGRALRMRRWLGAAAVCVIVAGCAAREPPALTAPNVSAGALSGHASPLRSVVGIASWYGPGFDGRPTATGEIYSQADLTAASNIFPLGSRVLVTNLGSGRAVEVRINDRGPFRKGRKIDLSYAAAHTLGMVAPGTAPVRMDLIRTPPIDPEGHPQYFVQLGSFAAPRNADDLRAKLAAYYPDVHVEQLDTAGGRYYRVRMGGFATRDEARARAAQTARFGLPIMIVSE